MLGPVGLWLDGGVQAGVGWQVGVWWWGVWVDGWDEGGGWGVDMRGVGVAVWGWGLACSVVAWGDWWGAGGVKKSVGQCGGGQCGGKVGGRLRVGMRGLVGGWCAGWSGWSVGGPLVG